MPGAGERLVPALALLLLTLATADDNSHSHGVPSYLHCGSQGKYAAGSVYEANLQHVVATVAAEVHASSCNCSFGRVAGDLPDDQVSASALCPAFRGANASSDCGACVEMAFREARRLCPYEKQADFMVEGGACSVSFHEFRSSLDMVFDDDVIFTGTPMIALAPSRWLDRVLDQLDPDLRFMLLFQATGILCIVLMLLVEWRRHVI